MISLLKSIHGKRHAGVCPYFRNQSKIVFDCHEYSLNEYLPTEIKVVNLTHPNIHHTLLDNSETQGRYRVIAENDHLLTIETELERHVVIIYNQEVVSLFLGDQNMSWPTQEEIHERISLIPEKIGRLLIQKYMNELTQHIGRISLFDSWPHTDLNGVIERIYHRMIQDGLEFTYKNVGATLINLIEDLHSTDS